MESTGTGLNSFTSRVRSAVTAAFGIATLCMLPVLGKIVSPAHITLYHLCGPVSALLVPILFNLLLLTALLTVLLCAFPSGSQMERVMWSFLLGFMPWVLLRSVSTLYNLYLPHPVSLSVFGLCFITALIASIPASQSLFVGLFKIGRGTLTAAAIFGMIMVGQTLWLGWKARHLNDVSTVTPSPTLASAPHKPRVIWIVFDEMSYEQVFVSRYPGIRLPNLDQFAQQAAIFSHVIPAGKYTDVILPSLISGIPDDSIRASSDGQHVYLRQSVGTAGDQLHWIELVPSKTVFAQAKSLGYRPAIVGWYNPYCRLLAEETASCFWTGQTELTAMFPAHNIRDNLFHPAVRLLSEIPEFLFAHHVRSIDQITEAQLHINDYTTIYMAADKVLANPGLDFVLLHLPIPHPNGIYDRYTGSLTTGRSTYLDNLVLADNYLGHVHEMLQRQGEWDEDTILITGDHSWRTKLLWNNDPRWSPEEQKASHNGQFDDRPLYAIKLPHQQKGITVATPFQALKTRSLLDSLLKQSLHTQDQLGLWVQSAN